MTSPVAMTRDQVATLKVVSYLDVGVLAVFMASIAIGLLLVGRPVLRRRLVASLRRRPSRGAGMSWWRRSVAIALALVSCSSHLRRLRAPGLQRAKPIPVLAYYYIWYDHSSGRARRPKTTRCSADTRGRQPESSRAARQVGAIGRDRRLHRQLETHPGTGRTAGQALVAIADQRHFKLAIIYQGHEYLPSATAIVASRSRPPVLPESRICRQPERSGSIRSHWSSGQARGSSTQARVSQVVAPGRDRLLILARRRRTCRLRAPGMTWSTVTRTTGRRSTRGRFGLPEQARRDECGDPQAAGSGSRRPPLDSTPGSSAGTSSFPAAAEPPCAKEARRCRIVVAGRDRADQLE